MARFKRKSPRRARASGRRTSRRRSGSKFKPSILTLLGLGYATYDAYKDASAAGSEKLNTFISSFTGIGLGRYSDNGKPTFNSANAMKTAAPIIVGGLASYGLNHVKTTKYAWKRVPYLGRRFKL